MRWNILISFATLDEVAGETKYFKEQCIAHQLSELSTEYRDVSGGRQPANADRVHAYGTKLEELLDWARSGRDKIMALHAAASKPGHKEELELWAKARKPAESLILKIEKRISNLGVPASGESLALRAEKRKAQKDHKKSKRRKQKRSQSVLTSRVTPPSSREPRLVQMFKKAQMQSQATPASLSATQDANDSSDVMLPQQRCAYPMWHSINIRG